MKKTFIFLFIIGIYSCDNSQKSNGFARSYDGPWKIGTQAGVDLVTELDKAWSNKDFEKMKMFFDDSATFLFAEGDRFNSVNGFIDHIKNQMGDDDANWTYDWAVAVDESPGEGGITISSKIFCLERLWTILQFKATPPVSTTFFLPDKSIAFCIKFFIAYSKIN